MNQSMRSALRTLADEAQSVDLFDRTLIEARSLKRRRTSIASVTVAIAVVAVVLASLQLAPMLRHGQSPATEVPTSPVPTSAAPTQPPPDPVGMDVLGDNKIWSTKGLPYRNLSLPPGVHAHRVSTIRGIGALLVEVLGPSGFSLYYDSGTDHPAQLLTDAMNSYAVSGDGSVLVVTSATTTAYSLPSLAVLGHTNWTAGMGPIVVGVSANDAWLEAAQGSDGPRESALWNFRSGALAQAPNPEGIWPIGREEGGRILRRVDTLKGTGKSAVILKSCIDLVQVGSVLPMGPTGACDPAVSHVIWGSLSPHGTWAVLQPSDGPTVLVATADLHRGVWKPILPAYQPSFWLDDQRYVTEDHTTPADGFLVCTFDICAKVVLPDVGTPDGAFPLVAVLNP